MKSELVGRGFDAGRAPRRSGGAHPLPDRAAPEPAVGARNGSSVHGGLHRRAPAVWDPYPHDFWAAPVGVVVVISLMQAGYHAELTEQALVLRGGTGRREVPWTAIRRVESRRELGTRSVVIHLVDGKTHRLRVPMSGFPYDPSFNRKIGTIQTWWAVRRGW